MKKIRDIFSGNEGFTLIELLIVIVIIGVLAAIAVPNIAGLFDSADEEVVRANMRTLLTEIEARRASDNTDDDINTLNAYVELDQMATDNENLDFMDAENDDDSDYESYQITAEITGDDAITFRISSGQLEINPE